MSKDFEKKIISQYQRDEGMMVLVFVQWCINHDLDPVEIYRKAYPNQEKNQLLEQMIQLGVSKEEAGEIPDQTLLQVLSLFGNEDLAFVVTQEIEQRKTRGSE